MSTTFKVFLTERETLEALGIGRSLLWRMMAEKRITGAHIGRRLVFHIDEIRRFADETQREAQEAQ